MSARFAITFFRDHAAREKVEATLTIEELAERVKTTSKPRKEDLPWLKLAHYGDLRSDRGSLRRNENVVSLSGVVVDYDAERVTPEEAAEKLDSAGVIGIVYTSPSHQLNGHGPRFRVVCPFSQQLAPDRHYQMVARLNGLLGGILASESFTLSQAYYFGSIDNNPAHQVITIDGTMTIDLCHELDEIAIEKPNGAARGENRPSGPPEAPIEDIKAALDVIPNPVPAWNLDNGTWNEWVSVGLAVWRSSGGSDEGREAFTKWSQKWAERFDPDETEFRWLRFCQSPPDSTGFGKLERMAREAQPGWVRPSKRPQSIVEQFNERYAVVNEAGKVWVFEQKHDPQLRREVLVRYAFDHFKKMYMNRLVRVETRGGKVSYIQAGNLWFTHEDRRQYLGGVVFDPTGRAPGDCWNLWRGFAVEPREGSWRRLRGHIEGVICSGVEEHSDYLLNTIARMVQSPEKRGEVAVVLRGDKGSGKGALCTGLKMLWGQHGLHIANAKHLVGNFNAHLRDCVFLFADEAFYAADRQHEGVLKALITEPTIPIEGKYQNVVEVPNLLHVWMSANSEWVVPASHDERRYFVLDVPATKVGDRGYFKTLFDEIDGGGLAAMLFDMLQRDISRFEHRDVPQTAALAEQKRLSLDTLDQWWLEVLDRGYIFRSRFGASEFLEWTPFVATELLTRSYLQWCSEHRVGYPASRELLGKRFTSVYERSRRGGKQVIVGEPEAATAERRLVKQDRAMGYGVGKINDARKEFASRRGVDPSRWKERDDDLSGLSGVGIVCPDAECPF